MGDFAILIAATAVALFITVRGPDSLFDQPGQAEPRVSRDEPLPPLGGTPAIEMPPLDASDAAVRELVRQLTSHPTVMAWLTTDGLIRNFTVATANVIDGVTPARHLRVLRPTAPFAVRRNSVGELTIGASSYHRYDAVAAGISSTRPGWRRASLRDREGPRCAGVPGTWSPGYFGRCGRDGGYRSPAADPDRRRADRAAAIGAGNVSVFSDPRLESLTAAQKQLLRMGPDNVRTIQRWLRAVAAALGIPLTRLPSPTD